MWRQDETSLFNAHVTLEQNPLKYGAKMLCHKNLLMLSHQIELVSIPVCIKNKSSNVFSFLKNLSLLVKVIQVDSSPVPSVDPF